MGLTTGQFIAFVRNKITDALNRQNTAERVRSVFEKIGTDYFNKASDALPISQVVGLQDALNSVGVGPGSGYSFDKIAATANYPAFSAQGPLNLYLLDGLTQGGIVPQPEAPTNAVVNDVGDTFQFTSNPNFISRSDYEFEEPNQSGLIAMDATNSYESGALFYVKNLTGPIPLGQFRVRVKASGLRPAGKWLVSNAPFTGTSASSSASGSFPYTFDFVFES